MSDEHKDTEQNRDKAAALFALAREQQTRGDYANARKNFEESLRLYEDGMVRIAYLKLLATVGPK